MSEPSPVRTKDSWDKAMIVMSPIGGLLTAVAVASLGFIGSRTIERQQSSEAKLQLYSELMTRREESEGTLRKEMFQSIIGSFFDPASTSMETKLLKLELLAQNFHEALDLTPLFQHLQREIQAAAETPAAKRGYENRLSNLAREVTRKQVIALEDGGKRFDWTVMMSDSLIKGLRPEQLEDVTLTLEGVTRRFRITLAHADTALRQFQAQLEIETSAQPGVTGSVASRNSVDFVLGFFDAPMINNTRLSNDQRVALVLSDMNKDGASLTLIYFPGSRASLREKPYYEEILRKLTNPQ